MATTSDAATRAPGDPDRTVRTETAINTVVTIAIAAAICWLLFRGPQPTPALATPPGGIFGILPGTFNFTLLVTIALTLVIRARVRAGRAAPWPIASRGLPARWLPANVLLRGLLLALTATALGVPAVATLVWIAIRGGLVPAAWPFAPMLGFYCVYFALLAWTITPSIVRRALADPVAARSTS